MTECGIVIDDLVFPECPRWHHGELWFTDMQDHRVVRWSASDGAATVVEITDDVPSGIGWLPDGRLLVVTQERQHLLRIEHDGSVELHADLSPLASGSTNDMIVRSDGVAYVGDMGLRIHDPTFERRAGRVLCVHPDGSSFVAADDLAAPNGMILSADERSLIVAESAGMRLTRFTIGTDGSLGERSTFADLLPEAFGVRYAPPDGICLDAEGAVWVADPIGSRLIRVEDGGAVTESFQLPDGLIPYACVLGGDDRRTLYVCAARGHTGAVVSESRTGRMLATQVAVPGAGAP